MNVLAFDTSAAHCSVALLRADGACISRHEAMSKGQAERLFPLVDELFSDSSLTWAQITAIGVGIGPGNFTGLRLSVAAARGLALGLGIPAYGVTVFDALADEAPRPLGVVQDARRAQVYAQYFPAAPHPPLEPFTASFDDAARQLGAVILCGSGADDVAARGAGTCLPAPLEPIAEAIARITAARYKNGIAPPRPAPLYLRRADALPSSEPRPVILDADAAPADTILPDVG